MINRKVASGLVHKVPSDLQKSLTSSPVVLTVWNNITPIARNEWICWIQSAKKSVTRIHRIDRTSKELIAGKHRPCCWVGCPHRLK